MAYITTALLKTYLGATTTADDTLLGTIVTRAQAIIDEEVGFAFEGTDATRHFNPNRDVNKEGDRLTLYFDTWLASLADSDPIKNKADGTPEAVAAANYYLLPTNEGPPYFAVRLLPSKGIAWEYEDDPDKGVSVEGVWAWSESAPDDIVHATIRLATFIYRQKDNTVDLDRPLLTASGEVILPSTLPNDVRMIIDKYRSLTAWPGSDE